MSARGIRIELFALALLIGCAPLERSESEENKLLVRRYYEEVVSTGDVVRLTEFVAPDYFETDAPEGAARGIAAAREHILGVRRTYPDLTITVHQQVAEGNWVATRINARGTHLGAWIGIAPTGESVEITGVNLDRVVDGKIVEHGGAANLLGPLLGIGAVRAVSE